MNPIVLLHGALGAGKQLQPIAEALKERTDRPVLIYNFKGHGGEEVPSAGFEMGQLAKQFGLWLSENNILGADIFGYSMGGYVALLTVQKSPERIRHILTLGTKFSWSPEGAKKETRYLDPELLESKVPHYAKHLESLHGVQWKAVCEATARLMLTLGDKPLLTEERLQYIQHPVVVTRGTQDKMVTASESEKVSLSLPDARYEELVGWEHPLEKLDPKNVADLIQRFLL